MTIRHPKKGDRVVYAKDKHSGSPGPRAQEVSASAKGDGYSYIVEKYWVVKEVRDDSTLLLLTRRGKEHVINQDDPGLRSPTIWERIFMRNRFPNPNAHESLPDSSDQHNEAGHKDDRQAGGQG